MHDFRGGGAERVAISLCNGLAEKDFAIILIVVNKTGPMLNGLNQNIEIYELASTRMAFAFFELSKEIKKLNPDLLISHMTHVNVTACLAAFLGRFSNKLVVVEHNQMAQNYKELEKRTVKTAYLMSKFLYKLPKKIIAVSEGVKNSITKFTWVGEEEVDVIYNPVVSDELLLYNPSPRAGIHPYFSENSPVFVCVGSLTKQKNFPLFLRAFRIVLNKENVNALILGEGAERDMLQDIISDLNLEANVQLPGFVNNPYDFIANADTFVLSSSWEGLPTVLIESLALSTNIVSTNCPSGPEEILESGKYGIIVELDDVEALAAAMIDSLTNKKAGLKLRAQDFSISKSIFKYSSLIN